MFRFPFSRLTQFRMALGERLPLSNAKMIPQCLLTNLFVRIHSFQSNAHTCLCQQIPETLLSWWGCVQIAKDRQLDKTITWYYHKMKWQTLVIKHWVAKIWQENLFRFHFEFCANLNRIKFKANTQFTEYEYGWVRVNVLNIYSKNNSILPFGICYSEFAAKYKTINSQSSNKMSQNSNGTRTATRNTPSMLIS